MHGRRADPVGDRSDRGHQQPCLSQRLLCQVCSGAFGRAVAQGETRHVQVFLHLVLWRTTAVYVKRNLKGSTQITTMYGGAGGQINWLDDSPWSVSGIDAPT